MVTKSFVRHSQYKSIHGAYDFKKSNLSDVKKEPRSWFSKASSRAGAAVPWIDAGICCPT